MKRHDKNDSGRWSIVSAEGVVSLFRGGGQNTPRLGGQFKLRLGGQFVRFFQYPRFSFLRSFFIFTIKPRFRTEARN